MTPSYHIQCYTCRFFQGITHGKPGCEIMSQERVEVIVYGNPELEYCRQHQRGTKIWDEQRGEFVDDPDELKQQPKNPPPVPNPVPVSIA